MNVALSLLGAALLITLGGIAALTAGTWPLRRPRLALALWKAIIASLAAFSLFALAWCVTVAVAADDGARLPWFASAAAIAAAWGGLAVAGGAASALGVRMNQLNAADREVREEAESLIIACAPHPSRVFGQDITVIEAASPLIFSVPGRTPAIVLSTGAQERLDEEQLRAVVEHERAHMSQRHDLVRRLALLGSSCLAGRCGSRRFERAANLLIELAADDAAARVCGPEPLAGALTALSATGGGEAMRLRAARLAARHHGASFLATH
ncbi:M56 family metallopeptidase [Sinomonas sp.]|uniref:M56 family metallopeptidase n=1 Tax=Sinomonas sp. TaxID=1914986 RepID=UPI002FE2E450